MSEQLEKTISFSSFSLFQECSYKWKLSYIDGKKFSGNIFSCFGRAAHEAVGEKLKTSDIDENDLFVQTFKKSLLELPEDGKKKLTSESIKDFVAQGKTLVPLVAPAIHDKFPGFELVNVELEVRRHFDLNFSFVGYIDTIIKHGGKYYIFDYKTCSWGWKPEKKTDKVTTYQLAFYKHFFSEIMSIPLKDIETYFILLKRTAKKDVIEFVRVPCGEKKIKNSLKMLYDTCLNINSSYFPKNRSNCSRCDFHNTEDCKKW